MTYTPPPSLAAVRASADRGVLAVQTAPGRRLQELLGVTLAALERWDTPDGRRWYVTLAGQRSVQGYRSFEFRSAASLNRIVTVWRNSQGNSDTANFNSAQAKTILRLMSEAVEATP